VRSRQTRAPYSKAFRSKMRVADWRSELKVAAKGIQEKGCGVGAKRKGLNSRSTVAEASRTAPAGSRFRSGSKLHNSSARAAPSVSSRVTERSAMKSRKGRQSTAASSHRGRMRPNSASRTSAAALPPLAFKAQYRPAKASEHWRPILRSSRAETRHHTQPRQGRPQQQPGTGLRDRGGGEGRQARSCHRAVL